MARRKSFKPEWDRGNGWKTTRDEWQDFDKAEEVTISIDQLADFKCPASGSTITITCDHIQPGLAFGLHVGAKEYRPNTRPYGNKYMYRKPTQYLRTIDGKTSGAIPQPSHGPLTEHHGAWHFKQSWSAAVKTLLNEIIPTYVQHFQGQTVQLRDLVQGDGN